jgi:ABC-type cobalamin transport system permease subunit
MVLKIRQFKDQVNVKVMLEWMLGRCADVDWVMEVLAT